MKIIDVRKFLENENKRLTIELGLYSGPSPNGDRVVSPFNKKMEAANEITDLEQRFARARRIRQQRDDIEHALEKISQGTYGLCDNCGKTIAAERLKVIPQASLCLDCKTNQRRSLLSAHAR